MFYVYHQPSPSRRPQFCSLPAPPYVLSPTPHLACTMAQVSSMSPDEPLPDNNGVLTYTSPESQHSSDRSPLSNFGFLKTLGLDKKQTKGMLRLTNTAANLASYAHLDGAAPKRRGPKPDSKPALTRRQELNRQAQRYASRRSFDCRHSVSNSLQNTPRTQGNVHQGPRT